MTETIEEKREQEQEPPIKKSKREIDDDGKTIMFNNFDIIM
jgi:hypothetical protein